MPATRLAERTRRRDTTPELSASSNGTEVTVPGAGARVHVADRPDTDQARRVLRTLDHVLWQRLEVRDGAVTGIVSGTRRRRPVQLRVGGGAALGLVERGVPTVVSRTETSA